MEGIEKLPPKVRLAMALEEKARRKKENKLAYFYPEEGPLRRELYPKHQQFFRLGSTHKTRGFIAANRIGKTEGGGGYEITLHLTGRYPEWWEGYRFERPNDWWVAGDTKETVRDIVQRKLLGPEGAHGMGLIPKDCVGKVWYRPNSNGAVDKVQVKHATGGWSELAFKSYDQRREAFQGTEKDGVWLDEEAPSDVRSECVMRLMTRGGLLIETFTPLMGATDTVLSYYQGASLEDSAVIGKDRAMVRAGWDDVPHLSEEEKSRMLAETPSHLREARSRGLPTMGSGRVFPVEEDAIKVGAFAIPKYWPQIGGIDFGWTHPTAAVWLAWDRDTDTVYITHAYRRTEAAVPLHAAALMAKGKWIPFAWPHDGNNDTAAGPQLAKQYKQYGVKMRMENAKFPLGSDGNEASRTSVEAGISAMLTRMETGRLKVFSHLHDWLEEFRLYHRKDGKVVKLRDDLLSATRYAMMDLRFAQTQKDDDGVLVPAWEPHDATVGY